MAEPFCKGYGIIGFRVQNGGSCCRSSHGNHQQSICNNHDDKNTTTTTTTSISPFKSANRKRLTLDPHRIHHRRRRQPQLIDFRTGGQQDDEQNLHYLYASKKPSLFAPATAEAPAELSFEYARRMRECSDRRSAKSSVRAGVEVQGGRIVRSIGRKDRHSKVSTAKGPRDRRVRLSALTAIQFYDVQDRLGYDRPSKAVDWLIKKAKSAIDKLGELPVENSNLSGAVKSEIEMSTPRTSNRGAKEVCSDGGVSDFFPSSFDSDSIADTMTSLFPMSSCPAPASFEFFPPDLSSRNFIPNQDLQLSLQSPITQEHQNDHQLFCGATPLDGSDEVSGGWPEHHAPSAAEISRLQRILCWNAVDADCSYNSPATSTLPPAQSPPPSPELILQPLFGENQLFSQRGPLQSSIMPSVFADYHYHLNPPSPFPGFECASGGFSRFLIPARFPGEEEHDGVSDKPSSASSNSRH